ncbi:cyclic nucleotide-binding domain-containing protein [Leptobacterium flavescens]|uniref:Cyclic nucleotide-binding domain-containing protein n=1 Tax=Leptobacterium flavescens TaxID=472055 RepID=A0A6P0UEZ9_9FLAO|nr:Crp/Fnr family transcriptional regulator [Leptobacterium flavescens]NER11844.1 cyclic nucleotide-binding domain-containing protein [Leptobacterium flavescens]
MDPFINYIKLYIDLSHEAETEIQQLALYEEVAKGHQLLEVGKTARRLYFIVSGTIRTFFYQKGKDVTYWIYPENSVITSWHSYLLKKPSAEYIEVIEDSMLISLSYDEWQDLYSKYPELERFGRLLFQEQIALLDDFYKGYYFMTAKEKYELLLQFFPDITLRANLGYIASMLGISQETLSRIRGK